QTQGSADDCEEANERAHGILTHPASLPVSTSRAMVRDQPSGHRAHQLDRLAAWQARERRRALPVQLAGNHDRLDTERVERLADDLGRLHDGKGWALALRGL